jgi:hypothetical protein
MAPGGRSSSPSPAPPGGGKTASSLPPERARQVVRVVGPRGALSIPRDLEEAEASGRMAGAFPSPAADVFPGKVSRKKMAWGMEETGVGGLKAGILHFPLVPTWQPVPHVPCDPFHDISISMHHRTTAKRCGLFRDLQETTAVRIWGVDTFSQEPWP